MPLADSMNCFDCAGPECPCDLGLGAACTYCSRLRQEPVCRCDWSGACVLLQLDTQRPVPAPGHGTAETRRNRAGRVLTSRRLADDLHEAWISVPRAMAPRLAYPGRFVFIRPKGATEPFATPLTVVDTSRHAMRLLFKVAGPKTQALGALRAEAPVIWRGPYPGGLMGLNRMRSLMRGGPGAAVVIARGLGQAVAIPLVRHLAGAGWQLDLLLDRDGAGGDVITSELTAAAGRRASCITCHCSAGEQAVLGALAQHLTTRNSKTLVVSCGSDVTHAWIVGLLEGLRPDAGHPALVTTNNSLMACGEGVCGACTQRLSSGDRFRACKADCLPEVLFARTRQPGDAPTGEREEDQ